jgi:membrane carboxypeptidase/penicillin-binding protein
VDRLSTSRAIWAGETGGSAALPTWISYMAKVLKDVPESFLPAPEGVVSVAFRAAAARARPRSCSTRKTRRPKSNRSRRSTTASRRLTTTVRLPAYAAAVGVAAKPVDCQAVWVSRPVCPPANMEVGDCALR